MQNEDMLDRLYNMMQEFMVYKYETELKRTKQCLIAMIPDPQAESAILDYGICNEKNGYRNGFIHAVQLMSQCIGTVPAPEDPLPFGS